MQNSCEEQPVYLAVLWGRQGAEASLAHYFCTMGTLTRDCKRKERSSMVWTKIDSSVCVALWTQQVWLSYDRHRGYRECLHKDLNWCFIVLTEYKLTAERAALLSFYQVLSRWCLSEKQEVENVCQATVMHLRLHGIKLQLAVIVVESRNFSWHTRYL